MNAPMDKFSISKEDDVVEARTAARRLAENLAFPLIDKTRIATAVSELARNVLVHGGGGNMVMDLVENGNKIGLRCIFTDNGPGIPDIDDAMADGFTTGNGLGQGLPGAKRLMDTFEIASKVGEGTRVEVVKWK